MGGVDAGDVVPDVAAGLGPQGLVVAADLGAEQGRQRGVRVGDVGDALPVRALALEIDGLDRDELQPALHRRCRRAAWHRRADPRSRRGWSPWRRGRGRGQGPCGSRPRPPRTASPCRARSWSPAAAPYRSGPGPAGSRCPSGSAKAASATALSNSSLLVSVPRVRSLSSVPRSVATASKVFEPSSIALRAASAAAASGNTICWIVRFSGRAVAILVQRVGGAGIGIADGLGLGHRLRIDDQEIGRSEFRRPEAGLVGLVPGLQLRRRSDPGSGRPIEGVSIR